MKEENKLGRKELKRVAKEFVNLVGKALAGENKVLYEVAELC